MKERTARIVVAAIGRFMDELPVVFLGAIALMIVMGNNADLIEKVVLSIVTGFLGYMKGRSFSGAAALERPDPAPTVSIAGPEILAPPAADEPLP